MKLTRTRIGSLASIVALTAIPVAVGGCAGFSQPRGAALTSSCHERPARLGAAPTVAVLVQQGMGPAATARGRAALDVVLGGARRMRAHLLVNGIGGSLDAPNMLLDTSLVAQGPNRLMREDDMRCKTAGARAAYRRIADGSSHGPLDVFDALRTLRADLTGVSHSQVDVVLLSSLARTTPVGLLSGSTLVHPAHAIDRLAAAGLNFRCDGWRVYAVGGGSQAVALDSELQRFWSMYFAHCGGNLVLWDDTGLAAFPLGSGRAPGADYSIVTERRGARTISDLSSDVLFRLESAVLQPAAHTALRQLLPQLASSRGMIAVDGYTDDTGSTKLNLSLSRARAAAVASWIEQHAHVPADRLQVRGLGSADPVAGNATSAGRARNRRVTVSTSSAASR